MVQLLLSQPYYFAQAAPNSSAATEAQCLEVSSRELSVMLLEDISRVSCVDEHGISATSPPALHSPRGDERVKMKRGGNQREEQTCEFSSS